MPKAIIAIINENRQAIAMLQELLEQAEFEVVSGRNPRRDDPESLLTFLSQHNPRVVIYDIPVPYNRNWSVFTLLRSTGAFDGRGVVITTTHQAHLMEVAGSGAGAIEIVGKPYDLQMVIDAVKRSLAAQGPK